MFLEIGLMNTDLSGVQIKNILLHKFYFSNRKEMLFSSNIFTIRLIKLWKLYDEIECWSLRRAISGRINRTTQRLQLICWIIPWFQKTFFKFIKDNENAQMAIITKSLRNNSVTRKFCIYLDDSKPTDH